MLDHPVLQSVADQLFKGAFIDLSGKKFAVRRTSAQRLCTVGFEMNGRQYQAIEQNPEKPSRWGQLARQGKKVVQFKDVATNRFVAVAVDGKIIEYGSGRAT